MQSLWTGINTDKTCTKQKWHVTYSPLNKETWDRNNNQEDDHMCLCTQTIQAGKTVWQGLMDPDKKNKFPERGGP